MICPSYIVPMLSIALIVGGTLLTRYGLNCDRDLLMVIGWLSAAAAIIVLTIWGIDHLPVPAYTSAKLTCSRPIAFKESEEGDGCPYSCDPVKAFGGPMLSRPELAFCGLVLFIGFMYFSEKGLERRPFGPQHILCWLAAVASACLLLLAVGPIILRGFWPLLMAAAG